MTLNFPLLKATVQMFLWLVLIYIILVNFLHDKW